MIKIDNDKLAYEREYLELGYRYICGIDEVGRGCLFGPVTAAAVIMPLSLENNKDIINGIEDSKKLTAKKREELSKKIIEKSISYSIYSISEKTIDEINILNATKSAMINAVKNLKIKPDILFIDASKIDIDIKQISIIKGDLKSYSIGCASILAKVCRDEIMNNLPEEYQKYKISKNKGYGTKEHLEAIKKYGPSNMHRFSFEPIKSYNHKDKKNDNNKDSFIL
ncbi:ribonuclease HII [Brachyspira aalborgi]|jgi:ribonuclease HII|uniref:ribonuclease HII n=1 Tax=Brachyspira aalborgi TaxID=29522 RepID=UPI0011CA62BD|nr:ribonuclease HII [Brachyspira aalborgi]TXJ14369.1 ribonuclease HII [Brachyspira aalborgi]TXJ19147.1 ribonuclease HII [Brachyspira aalborgi]TXJ47280.1 ribonuclease HII [Brachyspira aalborgi]